MPDPAPKASDARVEEIRNMIFAVDPMPGPWTCAIRDLLLALDALRAEADGLRKLVETLESSLASMIRQKSDAEMGPIEALLRRTEKMLAALTPPSGAKLGKETT